MEFRIYASWEWTSEGVLKKYPCLRNFDCSTREDKLFITIRTLEELKMLGEQLKEDIIVSFADMRIEIYDEFRE